MVTHKHINFVVLWLLVCVFGRFASSYITTYDTLISVTSMHGLEFLRAGGGWGMVREGGRSLPKSCITIHNFVIVVHCYSVVFCSEQVIFWSDTLKKEIVRANINGDGATTLVNHTVPQTGWQLNSVFLDKIFKDSYSEGDIVIVLKMLVLIL